MTSNTKTSFGLFLVLIIILSQFTLLEKVFSQDFNKKPAFSPSSCKDRIVVSSVYSPYRRILLKSEVSGRVLKINAKEGDILSKGTPIMELDCALPLKKELDISKGVLSSLENADTVLNENLLLLKKKYNRYLRLQKKGHLDEQSVEDLKRNLNAASLSLIENRQAILKTRQNIIELKDKIKKCAPFFEKDLYVSKNFKELYESAVPGEKLSKLLDTSRAKVKIVLPMECFSIIRKRLKEKSFIPFKLILSDGKIFNLKGKVEKIKTDVLQDYLYSYGFELVFEPIKELLWGQVVTVEIDI